MTLQGAIQTVCTGLGKYGVAATNAVSVEQDVTGPVALRRDGGAPRARLQTDVTAMKSRLGKYATTTTAAGAVETDIVALQTNLGREHSKRCKFAKFSVRMFSETGCGPQRTGEVRRRRDEHRHRGNRCNQPSAARDTRSWWHLQTDLSGVKSRLGRYANAATAAPSRTAVRRRGPPPTPWRRIF